jgi:MoaA/NifB/PqqE/SkfB family radical SAM enzyme
MVIKSHTLSVEVTTRCNLNCGHCFAKAALEEFSDMSYDMAAQAAREGREAGFSTFHITGGEPLLWPGLFDLLGHAAELDYEKIIINTNGLLLEKKICERLAAFGDKIWLTCSLNGSQKIHDQIRGHGSYDKAVKGIACALTAGLSVDIYSVLGRSLLADLPYYTESLFKELKGFRRLVLIQMGRVTDDAKDLSSELLSPRDFLSLVQQSGLLALGGYPIYMLGNPLFQAIAQILGLKWLPDSEDLFYPGKLFILQKGQITANHSSRSSYGKFQARALKETLRSSDYQRDTATDRLICPTCEFFGMCRDKGLTKPTSSRYSHGGEGDLFCQAVMNLLRKDGTI